MSTPRTTRRLAVLASLVLAPVFVGTLPGAPAEAVRNVEATKHVLVVGVDGLRWDRVAAANAPTLDQLAAEGRLGQSLLYANPMAATSSGPGWSTLLTGTWPDQHGVRDNSFYGERIDQTPDLLTRVERARPEADTWAAMDWSPIGTYIVSDEIDTKVVLDGDRDGYAAHDRAIAEQAAAHLRTAPADATFAYFGQQDIVGHESGAASQAYLDEIARVDAYVASLLAAIEARPTRATEDWLVLMGTDHGHTDGGGHGGSSQAERSTFVLAWGDGVPATDTATTRLVDLAATALGHLGVPGTGLAGRSVLATDGDDFEAVRPALRPAQVEPVPASTLGWTHELPAGWSQEVAMAPTGVPEWKGWTMTTDAFWTQAAPNQNREVFVRGRGVMAVADSDEWADALDSATARFDATLWAPQVVVDGKRALEVDLTHYYRKDGDSIAEIRVRVDGGAADTAYSFTKDTAGTRDTIRVSLPRGVTTAQVGFRHAGSNAWFWAVDDVEVRAVRR